MDSKSDMSEKVTQCRLVLSAVLHQRKQYAKATPNAKQVQWGALQERPDARDQVACVVSCHQRTWGTVGGVSEDYDRQCCCCIAAQAWLLGMPLAGTVIAGALPIACIELLFQLRNLGDQSADDGIRCGVSLQGLLLIAAERQLYTRRIRHGTNRPSVNSVAAGFQVRSTGAA